MLKTKDTCNAKQLEKIISNYIRECSKGAIPNLNRAAYDSVAEQTLQNPEAPPVANLIAGMFGGDGIFRLQAAWDFRDRVNEFQKEHNISSVYFREVQWKDKSIRYPDPSDQLSLMPQDVAICQRHKARVCQWFYDFCEENNLFCFATNSDGDPTGKPLAREQLREWEIKSQQVIPYPSENFIFNDSSFEDYHFAFVFDVETYLTSDEGVYIAASPINWARQTS